MDEVLANCKKGLAGLLHPGYLLKPCRVTFWCFFVGVGGKEGGVGVYSPVSCWIDANPAVSSMAKEAGVAGCTC